MQSRKNFDIISIYFLRGFFGLIVSLIILQLFYILEMVGREEHTFLYHWLKDQSPTHALTIVAVFVLMGFLTAGWTVIKDRLKARESKVKSLEKVSQAKT